MGFRSCLFGCLASVAERHIEASIKRSNYVDKDVARLAAWLRRKAQPRPRVSGGTEDAWWHDLWSGP